MPGLLGLMSWTLTENRVNHAPVSRLSILGDRGLSQGIPKEFWNDRFSADGYAYGTRPSRLLMAWAPELSKDDIQTALVPASGEGRDAVYLASLGLEVTAVDISSSGLEKTAQLAEQHGVSLSMVEADLFDWDWPVETFDVVAGMFAHMPSKVRRDFHAHWTNALKPGGRVLIEGFTKEQIDYQAKYQSGGPPDVDMLYARDDIRADFSDLTELSMMVGTEVLEEGPFHTGPAALLRAVYQKPKTG